MKKIKALEGTGYSLYEGSLDFGSPEQGIRSYDVIGRRESGENVISEFNLFYGMKNC